MQIVLIFTMSVVFLVGCQPGYQSYVQDLEEDLWVCEEERYALEKELDECKFAVEQNIIELEDHGIDTGYYYDY